MDIKPYLDSLIQTQDSITHCNENRCHREAMQELQQQRREQVTEIVDAFTALESDNAQLREALSTCVTAAQLWNDGALSAGELVAYVLHVVFPEQYPKPEGVL